MNKLWHYLWAALLITACLFIRIKCCPDCSDGVVVKTDTVWVVKEGKSTIINPVPTKVVAVSDYPKFMGGGRLSANSVDISEYSVPYETPDFFVIDDTIACDSIRSYTHHLVDSTVDITAISLVQGNLLFHEMKYTMRTPIAVTNIVSGHKVAWFVSGGAYGNPNGVSALIGGGVMFRRYGTQYEYDPFLKSHFLKGLVRVW